MQYDYTQTINLFTNKNKFLFTLLAVNNHLSQESILVIIQWHKFIYLMFAVLTQFLRNINYKKIELIFKTKIHSMEIKIVQNENEVYEKQKLLGEGAFGKAYLVRHKPTGQQLVIKQMNIDHMSTKQKQQTIKEAQILRNLSHPNIVTFKQVYVTKQNKLKIVMEYAECGDLAKAITQRKAKKQFFEQNQILDWFTQICLAIKHVHDRKIIHRDIKGQNIFIAKNNSLKLGDFGIARVLNQTHDKARTVVGTPYYLSPEIIQNKPYSFKSDIWSIGAVLYQMCALQPPFTATSLQMLALKIVKGSYPPIQTNYSKELKFLVSQLLSLDPNKRPSVNEILQKPVIQNRIRNFLSQTKRIAQFSHTILHNQKVQIFSNKLVQIQKQKESKKTSNSIQKKDQKSIQSQRLKLKERQAQIQSERLQKKKEQDRRIQEKRRQQQQRRKQDQIRKRQQEIKRKQQQKRRRVAFEQQKRQQMQRQYQENQRMAEMYKQRKIDQERQYQIEYARRQQYEDKKRREQQNLKKYNKKAEQQKRMQDFNDLARKQYFENLQIRKRAEQRARKQRDGSYYQEPKIIKQQPIPNKNFHYEQQNRPQTKQQSRGNSMERKQNNSDFYNRPDKKKDPQPTQEELINAFCNPNYNKRSSQAQSAKRESEGKIGVKKGSIGNIVQEPRKQPQSNKKIEDSRDQMKKDRQNFIKIHEKQSTVQTKQTEPEDGAVGKWGKRPKSSDKKKIQNYQQNQSPRFKSPKQSAQSPKKINEEQKGFDTLIHDSQNLFLQARNPAQFQKYIGELEEILQGVHKKIEMLPEIPLAQEIMFRDDDEFELSLTIEAKKQKQQEELQMEGADLDLFSNYSKLQTLRMQLQQALGLDNFIRLYRFIQKQVGEKGLQGFNIIQAIKQVGGDIDSKIVNKNVTLLLTLVALEDKMSYT